MPPLVKRALLKECIGAHGTTRRERVRLYLNYKTWHSALEAAGFSANICGTEEIRTCSSMKTIREWNDTIRYRYRILDRCIKARERFTERFFGNDMDFGHRTFWLSLVNQRNELERLLCQLEGRAYDLVLESQNATWVRDRQSQEWYSECSEDDEDSLSDPQQDSAAERKSRTSILEDSEAARLGEQVRWRISTYMLPTSSRYYEERKRVAWAYVCRAIYTDPALMLLALNYTDLPSFLRDPNHDVTTLRKLKQQMKILPVAEIWAAIDDILRPLDARAEYVTVLGIRIYKASSGAALPFHAWGHIFAFRRCSECVRSHCRTVDEIVDYSRYALLTGSAAFVHSLKPKIDHILGAVQILAVCGLLVEFPDTGKRVSVMKRLQADKTTIWEEAKNPPIVCAALSASDPNANDFLNELLRRCFEYKHLAVILRRGKDEPVIRSAKKIAGGFCRTSKSLAGLINGPWVPTFYMDSVLEVSPVHSDDCQNALKTPESFQLDCMQFVILDGFAGDCDEKYIVHDLLDLWCGIYDVSTVLELCHAIAKPYIENNELELDKERPERPFISNSECGFAAHMSLWGSLPTWMDEVMPITFPTVWPIAEHMPSRRE
ncbi:hypothetical protein B0H12DRAFT_1238717 [Mycena haematopus]|nr:hypothetical protein B0H12DRAFT_1238717 [Mycena haematopus]